MNRRRFVGSLAVLAVAASLPTTLMTEPRPPKLWGDGVHDDTEALRTLFDGEKVWYEREGRYLGGNGFTLEHATFICRPMGDGTYLQFAAGLRNVTIRHCTFTDPSSPLLLAGTIYLPTSG